MKTAGSSTLDAADMETDNDTVTVMEMGGEDIAITGYEYDAEKEFFLVHA